MNPNGRFGGRFWPIIAVAWAIVALSAALFRTLSGSGADETTLAFIAFAFLPFILNYVASLSLPGGTKIDFNKEASATVESLAQSYTLAITDIAQLLHDLMNAEGNALSVLRTGMDQAMGFSFVIGTIRDAMSVSTRWLAPKPDGPLESNIQPEVVRATLWRWDSGTTLKFVCGNVTSAQAQVLAEDDLDVKDADFMGDAWRNVRICGAANAPDDWRAVYKTKPGDSKPYPDAREFQGIMFVPVIEAGRPVGLLEFDREKAVRFDANAQIVAKALAALSATLLGDPTVRWGRR